ncbi:hypothetical protein KVP04_00420 [Halobacterium salinarum]|uniref:hypothetical protein n=1 Tax=Halobacterium salinarum TaxID=2242 RepID=UPI001F27BF75|nr:hypothetical protein [Halobacterium salinarum]MCF2165400.1 hypothetical protein [Halobacterium salinarum]MCF2168211.1 hypothetical protein [Halobacterium salinarum]MCF2237600.1 hypothetical protein [Halobacterium salinarum]
MAVEPEELDTMLRVLDKGHRELRDLGGDQPGVSFGKRSMRDLGLLDEDGAATDHEVLVTMYRNGRTVLDFQLDA